MCVCDRRVLVPIENYFGHFKTIEWATREQPSERVSKVTMRSMFSEKVASSSETPSGVPCQFCRANNLFPLWMGNAEISLRGCITQGSSLYVLSPHVCCIFVN